MTNLFLRILNMSISATWLALAVILLRFALKKTPKWVNVLLWGLVAIRLVCPFTLESSLSLVPSAQSIPQEILVSPPSQTQLHVESITAPTELPVSEDTPDAQPLPSEPAAAPETAPSPLSLLTGIWVSGTALLFLYTLLSYLRLRRQVRMAIRVKGNIYLSEFISSPFVLGIFKPRIYLPYHMPEQDRTHVIAHERTHIYRRDHWWKPLGFLLLSIHWFNPVLWAAYILLCRDIEMACDERVVQTLTREQRADYSQALLHCSVSRRSIAACPLAFGEVGVRRRVRNVLRYQRPTFWILLISLIVILVLSVCFLTDPKTQDSPFDHMYQVETVSYSAETISFSYTPENAPMVQLTKSGILMLLEDKSSERWLNIGTLTEVSLTKETFDDCFASPEHWTESAPTSLRTENETAWQVYVSPETPDSVFYFLLQQQNGSLYLTRGSRQEDGIHVIYHVFKLLEDGALPLAGKAFQVSGTRYEDPRLSSTWQFKGDLPYLAVTHSGQLLVRDVEPTAAPDENAPWTNLGFMEKQMLTTGNFDRLFETGEGQKAAQELRQNNQQAWKIRGEGRTLYYLLRQQNNDLFLACGQDSEEPSLRFLLKLEPVTSMDWSAALDLLHVDRNSCYITLSLAGTLPDGVCVLGGRSLQLRQGNSWSDVPPLIEGLTHADRVIEIPNAVIRDVIDWKETYGALPNGTYRIRQTITFCTPDGSLDSKDFYAEFTLGGDLSSQISFELDTITPTSLNLQEIVDPAIDNALIVGDFQVEALQEGQWRVLEPTVEIEPIFDGMDRSLNTTFLLGENYYRLDWSNLYGQLPPGSYRISREYTLFSQSTPSLQTVSQEFTIAAPPGIHIVAKNIQTNGLTLDILMDDTIKPGEYFFNGAALMEQERHGGYKTASLSSVPARQGRRVDITELPSLSLLWTQELDSLHEGEYLLRLDLLHVLSDGREEEITLYEYIDLSSYAWGVTLTTQDAASDGLSALLTCPNVPFGKGELTYSSGYRLEKRAFNYWSLLEDQTQNTVPVYSLTPGKTAALSQPLPDLPSGTYRLSKDITRHCSDGTTETRTLFTVFTLEGPKDLRSIPSDYTLEQAAADGLVTFLDGSISENEALWQNFLTAVNQGQEARVRTMQCYTLPDADRMDPEYYASIKDTYPLKFYRDIIYDGTVFTLETLENGSVTGKRYQYLRHFTGTAPEGTSPAYDSYEHYVLTNDTEATFDELWKSALSSQFGAYIDHVTVFSRYTYPS